MYEETGSSSPPAPSPPVISPISPICCFEWAVYDCSLAAAADDDEDDDDDNDVQPTLYGHV